MGKDEKQPQGTHSGPLPNNQQGSEKTKGNVEAAKKAYEESKKKESK